MEQISVRKVAHVILLARELERGEGELRGVIENMTEEEQAALVAIMWIGATPSMPRNGTRPTRPPCPKPRPRQPTT